MRKISEAEKAKVREMRSRGVLLKFIIAETGLSRASVVRICGGMPTPRQNCGKKIRPRLFRDPIIDGEFFP